MIRKMTSSINNSKTVVRTSNTILRMCMTKKKNYHTLDVFLIINTRISNQCLGVHKKYENFGY